MNSIGMLRLSGRTRLTVYFVFAFFCACSTDPKDGKKSDTGEGSVKTDARVRDDSAANIREDAAPAYDGGTRPTSDGSLADAASDAGSVRRPRLAASGAQLLVTGSRLGLQLTPANLKDDVDVIAVHQEFYGIPWAAFESDSSPPAEWTALMDELAALAKEARLPVFLSISMLNGVRERLAATTRIESGQVKTSDDTTAPCYDFAKAPDATSKRRAYLRYVEAMVERFQPAFLNIAIEINLFFEKCPAAVPGLVEVINAAYDAAKAKQPSAIVFPSFQIDHLYGYSKDSCPDATQRATCFDAHYAQLEGIRRDRFAMSTYPFLNQIGEPAALPTDWFSRAAVRGNERPLIAETGWPSTPLVAKLDNGSCTQVFSFDEATSAAYLIRVLSDAARLNMDLVTWWSDRDLVPSELMTDCPCRFDGTWCSVLDIFRGPIVQGIPEAQFYGEVLIKAFGTMGLRRYDGTSRSAHLAAWSAAR